MECFVAAAKAYAFTGDGGAHSAALAIAKAMERDARLGLIVWIDKAIGRSSADTLSASYGAVASRLRALRGEILMRDWSRDDAIAEMNELQRADAEYATALRGFDVSMFQRRHPQAFADAELWAF
jgi:hypothetical protein